MDEIQDTIHVLSVQLLEMMSPEDERSELEKHMLQSELMLILSNFAAAVIKETEARFTRRINQLQDDHGLI